MKKVRAEWWDNDTPWCPPITVYEDAPEPVDTGLLNADGTKIFRRPDRHRIGFDLTPKGIR